jgi:hypothetical protein
MNKLITAVIALLFCHLAFADTCPSVKDLKAGTTHGFQAYDSDDDTLLAKERLAQFINNAEQFILAEWQDTKDHEGAVHCYYRDINGSQMDAYLKKSNLVPANPHKRWYEVSGSMHCAADMESCLFKENKTIGQQPQLAKK